MTSATAPPRLTAAALEPDDGPDGPGLPFDHLIAMSDDTGLFEHAWGVIPRREHGYCVDDVARGLVVLSRERRPSPRLLTLARTYLAFVSHAQEATGRCHNRLGYERLWQDEAGTDDCWGRALWGLGSLAAGAGMPSLQMEALDRFELSASCRSPWRRATAFAALGALAVQEAHPDHPGARALLADALPALGRRTADPRWPWPEERLTYANASVVDAMIGAGHALGDHQAVDDGLALLAWLFEVQTCDGHVSPIPVIGWAYGEPRPAFDQQPIEVAALADAAARAFTLTADDQWATHVQRCVDWFSGDNDSQTPLFDPATGGGFDGLERDGRNANQGAESTLAALAVRQLARPHGARC